MTALRVDDESSDLPFDPQVEVSPFALFRRLKEGNPPLLVDLRPEGEAALTLCGALRDPGGDWRPAEDRDVVLFDQDGTLAPSRAGELQAEGWKQVRALFGGIDLYAFALDPLVVGEERFLVLREP